MLLNKKYIFAGPMFHPEMHGSLAFFRAILNGEKLKEIPNDSMSFIDVRDLAELELAALENKNARGKYTKNRLHFLFFLKPLFSIPLHSKSGFHFYSKISEIYRS